MVAIQRAIEVKRIRTIQAFGEYGLVKPKMASIAHFSRGTPDAPSSSRRAPPAAALCPRTCAKIR